MTIYVYINFLTAGALAIFCNVLMLLLPGALLLEEVVSCCGREGIDAIIDAASERFNESQREKAAGSSVWWRVSRELFGF